MASVRFGIALTIALSLILATCLITSAAPPSPSPTENARSSNKPDPQIRYFDPVGLAKRKHDAQAALASAQAVGTASPVHPPIPAASVSPSQNQPGLSANDNNLLTGSAPSDANGAIGPNNYVEMVNQRVAAYDRSLTRIGNSVDMANFANVNNRSGVTMTDPQVEWDQQGNRWLYSVIGRNPGGNWVFYGWSKTSDPTNFASGWCKWDFQSNSGNDEYDYPKLGHDASSIVIGANLWDTPSGGASSFVTATILVFKKPATGVTTCTTPAAPIQSGFRTAKRGGGYTVSPLNNFDMSPTWTPVPANTTDSGASDYIVAAHLQALSPYQPAITLFHLAYNNKGVPSVVTDADIPVSAYLTPPPAPQAGSSNLLDTLDTRLTQAVARVDPDVSGGMAVWTQHTISEPSRPQAMVRWYEINAITKTIRQSGDLDGGVNIANFNAAISPTLGGNEAVLQYNQSSSTALVSIVVQSRLSSTPLGQMDPVVTGISTVGTSPSQENGTACPACRWGDYSAATPDPISQHTVWATGALTGSANFGYSGWSTRNFVVSTWSHPYCITAPIAAGYYHTLALALDGTVWAWGATGYGQVGAGPAVTNQLTPTQVFGPGAVGLLTGISYVAAGQYHSLALRQSDGSVWAWGNDIDGELGDNDPNGTNRSSPVQVAYASGGTPITGISDIASHNSHSLAIRRSDGTVWAWGLNTYGQLGNSSIPLTQSRAAVQVMGPNGAGWLTGIVKVAVGDNFSVAIDSAGNVYAWGDDSAGQLGDNRSGFGVMSQVPIQVHGLGNVGTLGGAGKVASRSNGTDVMNSDHTLSAWGTGNQPSSLTPVIVPMSSGSGSLFPIFAVSASVNNTYAADYSDVTLWDWGDNTYGQIGDGTTTFQPRPTHVLGLNGVGLLSPVFYATGGAGHSIAVLESGAVAAWGLNSAGQLGDGSTANRLVPYQVSLASIHLPTSC